MLEIAGLALRYPGFEARYDLAVPAGALCAVIGPSGGGKTTLLHAIAGFERPHSGTLRFAGQDLLPLAPAQRPVSILFQDHNLFPHLTAAENVALGLKPSLRLDDGERQRVAAALAEVSLTEFASRRPAELSGGQRQRVALARALLRGKPLMLLDEPFGALDPGLRREMIARVDALRRSHGLTVLMTLHTPEEAAQTSELFAFVAHGRVEAAGPWERLTAPDGPEPVRRFLGL
ncbi:thiamine ABC transporter ATP-binding protein [Bosea sp. WAO]|uniref:thiamine ABC transporter ATP-binding protein n=1 Tax=Bosea sp. WAO TaxID=406341 RepID=UPI0007481F03|nr:ATP-binding cassette domain-containing protein [Bosea sp. WAO]KUL95487.1 thiamine ABC transporter ATP-binding protein [Bosea sp. WAO]